MFSKNRNRRTFFRVGTIYSLQNDLFVDDDRVYYVISDK